MSDNPTSEFPDSRSLEDRVFARFDSLDARIDRFESRIEDKVDALDGRDVGTVVFPSADVKFFLTAMPEARARRRLDEEQARDRGPSTFEATLADINERDLRDATRDDSPLRIADDAVVIDTTELSVEEVFQRMLQTVRDRHNSGAVPGKI